MWKKLKFFKIKGLMVKSFNFVQKSGLSGLGENISQSENFANLAKLQTRELKALYGA